MREVYRLTLILKKYSDTDSARITLIARMIMSVIRVRTVCLSETATGFAGKAGAASDEKRIHRFLKDFPSDTDTVALSVSSENPEGQRILTKDRTFREFGRLKINILMSAVVHKGAAIPLLRKFPGEPDSGKKGSSDTGERIGLMTRFIRLSGARHIGALCADSEFIGSERSGRLCSR